MSSEKGKEHITPEEEEEEEKERVKQCIQLGMKHSLNANEVKHALYEEHKIDKRSFPEAIWQEFEKQKQELFDNYSKLIMRELHIKQPEMMNLSNTPPGWAYLESILNLVVILAI
ncbi:hypothetical protein Hdeb2414_s0013g00416791 [Helianthus debilis subsp. tardiflorus]